MSKIKKWIPEITYEADDGEGQLQNLPMIHVPKEHEMPKFLLIWEARNTGTFEPGLKGQEVPVVDWELRQYAKMETLKESLSPEDYDKVRKALGLQPLLVASEQGHEISNKVRETLETRKADAKKATDDFLKSFTKKD